MLAMGDRIDFELQGIDEVLARMKSISHDAKYKGGRFALRKAATLVASKAKEGAAKINDPRTTEEIQKNIAVRFSPRRFKATGDLKFRVGVMGGAKAYGKDEKLKTLPGGDTRHWRHVEFGSEHNSPARPFMRTALSQNINQAIAEFARHYGPAIDRAIKRAKK